MQTAYIKNTISVASTLVPVISTEWSASDFLGAVKARWAFNRRNYKVQPGIYAVGNANADSPVFVTANYKLSFDVLRKNMTGLHAWILVLDTKGVNVWCAAGKGTFGTDELIRQISLCNLHQIVNHRSVILPQLGAPGIMAHEVKKQTGFRVVYGPVRASDIASFVQNNFLAKPSMRVVEFPLRERVKLIPVEFVGHFQYLLVAIASFLILSGFRGLTYSLDLAFTDGVKAASVLVLSYLIGSVFVPALLPYIPVKAFSLKGALMGLLGSVSYVFFAMHFPLLESVAWVIISVAISSFIAMNFTGASTYTSLSGVLKEMKYAVPAQLLLAVSGLLLWIVARLFF